MLYNTNQLVRQNLKIFKISHVCVIIEFIQTFLQIKYKNLFFFINFFINLFKFSSSLIIFNSSVDWKSKFKNYNNNISLIFKVGKSDVKLERSLFMTFLYYMYVFTISQDIVEIYLSSFLLLTGVLIKLIKIIDYWINNEELKKDFPIFHSIIKYALFGLFGLFPLFLNHL